MELWNVTSDLVPWMHESHLMGRTYRPWNDVELLEITPEWTYGAHPSNELIYDSNNHVTRETLSAYSDGMGGNCADHITVERGMLCVPLWRDDYVERAGGYHPAAIVGLSLIARLDDYPLLDEDDYCDRESAAWDEYLEDEFKWVDDGEREDNAINSHRSRFLDYCLDHFVGYFSVFDVPSEYFERAYIATREEN